jgi:hypothetical protein
VPWEGPVTVMISLRPRRSSLRCSAFFEPVVPPRLLAGVKKYLASMPTSQLQAFASSEPSASAIPDWGSGNAGGNLLIGSDTLTWEPSQRLAHNGVEPISVPFATITTCRADSGASFPASAYLYITMTDGRPRHLAVTDRRDLLTVLQQAGIPLSVE